ncbi:34277_t:CDS:1, partial [Gigaspora margarita]
YYNYDFINTSANHAAVRCWHKKEKSLLEISEEVFAQIRKKTGLSESTAHKEKRRNESRELDQLQEKIARLRRSKKSAQIELKEYEKKLKIFKEGIITDIRKLLTSSQLTITELDARE